MRIQPLVLAAGKGTRMRSSKPKVLQPLGGQPMLGHVLDCCNELTEAEKAMVVVGFGADQVRECFGDRARYVQQTEQLGTGHAVQMASSSLEEEAIVLILYGDVPFISAKTLISMMDNWAEQQTVLSLLTVDMDDPSGYGRIVRDDQGNVLGIVEEKDASAEQKRITEVNTGIMAVQGSRLKAWVAQLSNDNAQGEYYLTDIVAMAVSESEQINVVQPESTDEVMGANDRKQLADLERCYRHRQAASLMNAGVTLADPSRVDVRGRLEVGRDVHLDVNLVFEGQVTLANDVTVEANCVIKDSVIEAGARIRAFSHLDGVRVGAEAVVGPYARLREGSVIGNKAKIGNFVETKKVYLGEGSKANHLTYLGDTDIGVGVNIGAGTITCNYDGKNKHKTRLEDDVFIGSNTALVAPVTVGKGATVAAGTIVTKDVDANSLAIARPPQRGIDNWSRPDQQDIKK